MTGPKVGSTDMIVALTAAGRPQAEVAAAAGVSVRTLRRRLREPQMVVAVSAAAVQLEREAVGRIGQLRGHALERLEALIGHEDPSVALRAAKLIFETSLARRAALVNDNLSYLEAAVAEGITAVRREHRVQR